MLPEGITLSVAKGKRHGLAVHRSLGRWIEDFTLIDCVAGAGIDDIAIAVSDRQFVSVSIQGHQLRQIEPAIGRIHALELIGRHGSKAGV